MSFRLIYIKLYIFIVLLVGIGSSIVGTSSAQVTKLSSDSLKTQVSARVGEYYLNLSGYSSPYASIVLTIEGTVYRSSVADEKGNFSITGVLIKEGFSGFCLQAIDFKRLGESLTCFHVPPATGSVEKHDIFLPPTIGLQRSTIEAGSDAVIFGYTMPGASVVIHSSDFCTSEQKNCKKEAKTYEALADEKGYYEVTVKNLDSGAYSLFATATYKGKPSEAPSNTLKLVALTLWEQLLRWLKMLVELIVGFLRQFGLGPLWLLIPLLPVIAWFVVRIWPERFTWIYNSRLYSLFGGGRKRRLHHWWFVGY